MFLHFTTTIILEKTKNIYSYMHGEFMIKDYVPLEFVRAIGVPYKNLKEKNGKEYADMVLVKIKELMEKYDIILNVVDTNSYNKILIDSKKSTMPSGQKIAWPRPRNVNLLRRRFLYWPLLLMEKQILL